MASKVKCSTCKEYIAKDTALHVGISSFCNRECMYAKGDNKTKKPRSKASKAYHKKKASAEVDIVSEQLAEYVLRRDRFSCRLCGRKNNLALHHVIYKSQKTNQQWCNEQSNLITLCNEPCHLDIVHKYKNRFQKLCLGVIWLIEVENKYINILDLEKQLKDKND